MTTPARSPPGTFGRTTLRPGPPFLVFASTGLNEELLIRTLTWKGFNTHHPSLCWNEIENLHACHLEKSSSEVLSQASKTPDNPLHRQWLSMRHCLCSWRRHNVFFCSTGTNHPSVQNVTWMFLSYMQAFFAKASSIRPVSCEIWMSQLDSDYMKDTRRSSVKHGSVWRLVLRQVAAANVHGADYFSVSVSAWGNADLLRAHADILRACLDDAFMPACEWLAMHLLSFSIYIRVTGILRLGFARKPILTSPCCLGRTLWSWMNSRTSGPPVLWYMIALTICVVFTRANEPVGHHVVMIEICARVGKNKARDIFSSQAQVWLNTPRASTADQAGTATESLAFSSDISKDDWTWLPKVLRGTYEIQKERYDCCLAVQMTIEE